MERQTGLSVRERFTRKKGGFTAMLAILFLLAAALFSAFFLAAECAHVHDASGHFGHWDRKDCPVCTVLRICRDIHELGEGAAGAIVLTVLCALVFVPGRLGELHLVPDTLCSWKVRLND